MTADELRALQAPVKTRYKEDPASAQATLRAEGTLQADDVLCMVPTFAGTAPAGLHAMTGGDGSDACAADMLLQGLVACAGVTLRAVATSLHLDVAGTVHAEGDLDFRGTLGVDKQAPVGIRDIRLTFDLATDADAEQLASLIKLTERYCVVLQTIRQSPATSVHVTR